MSSDRWRQVKEIAHVALGCAPADRARFLDQACSDPEIRKEVESLLAHEMDGFLETPVAPATLADERLADGARLGHYEILGQLGVGGMGEVYRARDTRLGRDVAIKVLPPGVAQDRDRVARFEREAKAVAALDHPNIVTLYSVEDVGGTHFITMQLVQGKTLSQVLPADGLPLDRFFALAIPLTDAICAAHRQGITHRDLKPANVMVGTDGRVRVLDFGLAKLLEDVSADGATELPTEHLTQEGRVMGTVAYMSPEQAEGKAIDHRSDIFSLGILLYEMATGQRPFTGETSVSIITSILRDEATSITDLNGEAPRHLARIIKRALAKEPGRRYQTAIDLRNELEELQEEVGLGTRSAGQVFSKPSGGADPGRRSETSRPPTGRDPSSDSEILVGLIRRHRRPVVAVAMLGVAAILALYQMLPAPGAERPVDRVLSQLTTFEGLEFAMSWSPDEGFIAVSHSMNGSFDIIVMPLAGGRAIPIATSPRDEVFPRWSPNVNDGWIAYQNEAAGGTVINIVRPLGGDTRTVAHTGVRQDTGVSSPGVIGASPWSPDGRELLFSRLDDEASHTLAIYRVDVTSSEQQQLTYPARGVEHRGASWSPDGAWIVFVSIQDSAHSLWLMPAEGGDPRLLLAEDAQPSEPEWMPDSRTVVFVSPRAGAIDLWAIDIDDKEPRPVTSGPIPEFTPMVSRSGRIAFTTFFEHRADLYWLPIDSPDAEPVQLTAEGTGLNNFGAQVSPGGDRIAYYSTRALGLSEEIYSLERASGNLVRLTNDPARDVLPDWSPEGDEVVFLSDRDGIFELWVVNTENLVARKLLGRPVAVWQVGSTMSQGPRWAPDGEAIGFLARQDDVLGLWTVSRDGTDARLRLPGVLWFDWYKDGRRIIYCRRSDDPSRRIQLWTADLESGSQALLLDEEVDQIAVVADGSAISYQSAVSHLAMKLQIRKLIADDPDGLPLALGDARQVPVESGVWHLHNGAWAPDGSGVVYTRTTAQGDIWVSDLRQ